MADSDEDVAKPQEPLFPGDSFCAPRSVHSSNFRGASLREKRLALLDDLGGHVPEFPVEQFLDIFLPPLKNGISIDSVLDSLTRSKHIKNGKWALFPEDPKRLSKKERDAFQGLENIFDKAVQFARKGRRGLKQTSRLRMSPDDTPRSEKSSKTYPDASFILKGVEDHAKNVEHEWYNLAGTCEFKVKDNEDTQDDVGLQYYQCHCSY